MPSAVDPNISSIKTAEDTEGFAENAEEDFKLVGHYPEKSELNTGLVSRAFLMTFER